jgi:biopolymer transport protein ExbB/TolQ
MEIPVAGTIISLLLLSLFLVVLLFSVLSPLIAAGVFFWRWRKSTIRPGALELDPPGD